MSLDDTEITFYGLSHLVGKTVQASIGGLDCGDYTVADDGSITVPFGSDADALFTPAYLYSLDGFTGEQAATVTYYYSASQVTVTVPVVIGQGYTSQAQVLRAATQEDIKSPSGAALGKKRRGHKFAALMENTGQAISFGTDFTHLRSANFLDTDDRTPLTADNLFSGVFWKALDDGYSYDSMLCWEVTRPFPCTVVALSTFIETQEG